MSNINHAKGWQFNAIMDLLPLNFTSDNTSQLIASQLKFVIEQCIYYCDSVKKAIKQMGMGVTPSNVQMDGIMIGVWLCGLVVIAIFWNIINIWEL